MSGESSNRKAAEDPHEDEDPTVGILPVAVLSHIGEQLRRAFAPPEADDLPSQFAENLARLEARLTDRRNAAAERLRSDLTAAIPALRAFAFSLTYDPDRSDDLVQDTLVRAWAKADTFTPGTHLIAWLFTILRNLFYSEQRKRKREVEDVDGAHADRLIALPDHQIRLDLADFRVALDTLPVAQREALLLVGAQGFSYEETAEICGVAIGTIKSRVNRARTMLVQRLGMEGSDDIGLDAVTRAASGLAP
jgi:RNA polymerase sigma factor (sigma-70 family)